MAKTFTVFKAQCADDPADSLEVQPSSVDPKGLAFGFDVGSYKAAITLSEADEAELLAYLEARAYVRTR